MPSSIAPGISWLRGTLRAIGLASISVLAVAAACFGQDAQHNFLMRFPDVHGDRVVFVAGGDIWIAPVQGGVATRLTTHDGDETLPKFSNDGSLIAFTAEYDGNADVYVMDTYGGNIRRVTFHPDFDAVIGWDPVKNKIMFTSGRTSFGGFTRLFLIDADGTGLEEAPLPEVAQASFSGDGKHIAFAKVSVDGRTWKRYRGGLAPDIFIFDFATKKEINVSNSDAIDSNPMWIGDMVYFVSDRDRVLNVWAYDTKAGKLAQITKHTEKEYDVRRPSMGGTSIVYELGGDLYLLDTVSGKSARIPVDVRADTPELRPYLKSVDGFVTEAHSSPDGKTALLVARGELFTVPRKEGITRNLTGTSSSRDKDAAWSPDGATIAFFSDGDGECNLYTIDAAGAAAPKKLTDFRDGYRHAIRWSPDGERDRVHRSDPDPVLHRRRHEEDREGRQGRIRERRHLARPEGHLRLLLVPRQPLDRVLENGRIARQQDLHLLSRNEAKPLHQRGRVQRFQSRILEGRRAPVLRLQPALRSGLLRFRVGNGLQEARRDLQRPPAEGRRAPLPRPSGKGRTQGGSEGEREARRQGRQG